MRLNYKNYPIWQFIDNKSFTGDLQFLEPFAKMLYKHKLFHVVMETAEKVLRKQNKVRYISKPFVEALIKGMDKIDSKDVFNWWIDDCGIMMLNGKILLYDMYKEATADPNHYRLFLLEMSSDSVNDFGITYNDDTYIGWTLPIDGKESDKSAGGEMAMLQYILYFIHNCEIEEVKWEPKGKLRKNGQRAINETKTTLNVIDCSWFRKIVAEVPVDVEGFFRWQAHGERWSKRKLIWVEGFQRKYSRKARKEGANL